MLHRGEQIKCPISKGAIIGLSVMGGMRSSVIFIFDLETNQAIKVFLSCVFYSFFSLNFGKSGSRTKLQIRRSMKSKCQCLDSFIFC